MLRIGSRGPTVRALQRVLIRSRLLSGEPPEGPDGVYGALTARAVRAWQQAHKRPATGQVDDALAAELGILRAISNAIIVDGRRVKLPRELLEAGVTATNYLDDGEHRFRATRRIVDLRNGVLHESVTDSTDATIGVLRAKRRKYKSAYGIHVLLGQDGHISCHADLARDALVHGNQLNRYSWALEVVNPYAPKYDRAPLQSVGECAWWTWTPKGEECEYTLPTPEQVRTLLLVVPWLCAVTSVPYQFPTRHLGPHMPRITGWDDGALPGRGIVAHRDYATHSDGRYPLEFLIRETSNAA
jgi:hypothetical protein